ncbi:MAG: hypothetical protein ACT4O6_09710 [Reyranella sp.]
MHRIAIVALGLATLVLFPLPGDAQQTTAPAGTATPTPKVGQTTGTSQSSTTKKPNTAAQTNVLSDKPQKNSLKHTTTNEKNSLPQRP